MVPIRRCAWYIRRHMVRSRPTAIPGTSFTSWRKALRWSETRRDRSAETTSMRDAGGGESVESKLARVGLELISEREAGIPPSEQGRYVPCRVLTGVSAPLTPDPAGYLIVGFDGELVYDAGRILSVLGSWRSGETISLWVRRNPHLAGEPDWWEVNSLPVTLP